ncbi:MAG: sulfite exporter TauE/SafE family protein [Kofleriaceae bacterium]
MDAANIALVGSTAFAAGLVNAIAGGGSLITFPALVAVGLPVVEASLTNTVALCPGYIGATFAQRADLVGQRSRMVRLLPAGAVGGTAGALLLLLTGERAFAYVVPFLILFAAVLLAGQERMRRWLDIRVARRRTELFAAAAVGLAAVYGGYFGAGMGVMILASLGVVFADSLTRLNALKQTVSLSVNLAAATVFLVSGRVDWSIASVMLACSLAGGIFGGMVASKIPTAVLRWLIVSLAVVLSVVYVARW